jgi:very-short-patch-repair endonuclease
VKKSRLERAFQTYWRQINGPPLEAEYRFHPKRKWRFDFAAPGQKVAIELEGGSWTGGRHVTGIGFQKDCEKYNAAAMLGWRVFRFTSSMLRDDPVGHLVPVKTILNYKL